MSVSLFRARKKIKQAILDLNLDGDKGLFMRAGLQQALVFIDEELEADSEREFIKPITPSLLGTMPLFGDSGT